MILDTYRIKSARWLGVAVDSAPFYKHKIQDIYLTYYSALRDVGRDSSVTIVTRYGQDCPGIESRWYEIFRRQSLGPT